MSATVSSFVGAFVVVVLVTAVGVSSYVTAKQYAKRRWLQQHGLRALGVVVRLETDTGDFETAHYPVVRFHPAGQAPLEARYDLGNPPARYAMGETVLVRYDPNQPTRFVLGDETGQGGAWLLALGLVGGILAYCVRYHSVA